MSWSKGLSFGLQIANGMAHLSGKEVQICMCCKRLATTIDAPIFVHKQCLYCINYFLLHHPDSAPSEVDGN